jgi:alkylation response protein AidB-like acyl-CoA dehydrogenase
MTATTSVETSEWLVRARDLAPIIAEHRDEGERERHLPQPIYEAMRAAGLYNMLLPKAFGGYEADLVIGQRVVEEIARYDGAVAWNIMIGSQGGMFSDYLPESAAAAIYGNADTVGAGSFGPTGQAIPVPGGYRLSGRWAFASGCKHANWFVCGALIVEDGKPRMLQDGRPDIQLMFVPASEGTILDTWHSGGLRGTGSHDIEVRDAFVPEDYRFSFFSLSSGPELRASTAYTQPFMLAAGVGMAALTLGIARDALDSFKAMAVEKTPSGSSSKLATQAVAQDRYAEATALVGSARSYFYDALELLAAVERPDTELTAQVRLATVHAVRSSEQAVEILYSLGGGSAVYNANRLDRCFRDVHTASHHIAASPSHFEMVGQFLLTGELGVRK